MPTLTRKTKTNWNTIRENLKLTSEIVKKLRKHFKVWVYDEENLDKNFLAPRKVTTRTFAPNVEADPNLANKSADDLEKEGVEPITLRERLIMELQYFKETGKHLDLANITLCAGSRSEGGDVPCVDWGSHGGRLYVGWFYADDRSGGLRSRAVSKPSNLPLKPSEVLPRVLEINGIKYTRNADPKRI